MFVYAKLCSNLQHNTKFLICIMLGDVLLITPRMHSIGHVKLTPGWVLIRTNFDPIQEIGPKVRGGHPFAGGRSFARLRHVCSYVTMYNDLTFSTSHLFLQQWANVSYSYSTVPGIYDNKQTESKI